MVQIINLKTGLTYNVSKQEWEDIQKGMLKNAYRLFKKLADKPKELEKDTKAK